MTFHKVCTLGGFRRCACWQCASSGFPCEEQLFGKPSTQIQLHRPSFRSLIPANLKSSVSVPPLYSCQTVLVFIVIKYISDSKGKLFIFLQNVLQSRQKLIGSHPLSVLLFHVLPQTVPGFDHFSTNGARYVRVGHMPCFNVVPHIPFFAREPTSNTLKGSLHSHHKILVNCIIQFSGNS